MAADSDNSREKMLATTESVCPECLRRIPAVRVACGDSIYLDKTCPEHGHFRTRIWQGEPAYHAWARPKPPSQPPVCATKEERGCPFDCGLCPEHRQHTCCVLLEVTQRCNLGCPVCFASSRNKGDDPDISVIEGWYRMLLASGGPYNIQLSGGEPTMRDDLPRIIALGRSLGFNFMQLNTNGLRLAEDDTYVKSLKAAGLDCVFLQFDGTKDAIYEQMRGAPLLAKKMTAIRRCAEGGLGVVLTPTLAPGVNTDNIGAILQFAIDNMPAVRGVHFQPVSYFGRYPQPPADGSRLTIPEVIREIERQTGGRMKAADFHPPGGENAYCSFNGNFVLMPDGQLKSRGQAQGGKCCSSPVGNGAGAANARDFVARQWAAASGTGETACCAGTAGDATKDSFDEFLERITIYTLAVSGMAFQDAWSLDLERLKECFIHIVSQDGKLIPFCAYNLTSSRGQALYRGRGGNDD